MSKKLLKLKTVSVILMALSGHAAYAASSYAEDQGASMSGRAAMTGGSVASQQSDRTAKKSEVKSEAVIEKPVAADSDLASANESSADSENLIKGLIKQAVFWHDKQQHDRAMQSLKRVLIADPHNEECLYLMSLWSFEVKDEESAKMYRDRLYKISPGSSYILQLDNQKSMEALSSDQLNHARALASSGNVAAALAEYQKLFTGVMPPKELVTEYYLTMSGDPNYYQRAVSGIVSYIKTNPNDINAQITYGKILSYRQSTIRKGIAVLDYYADESQDADKALRQALLWLEPDESDEKYYSAYLKRHPNDQDVKTQYDSSIIGGLVKKSSENSNTTDKQNAIRDFEKIIAKNPNNQYALEAVGYLHLELKNYVRAHEYLSKAASLGGSKQAKLEHDASIALVNQYQATGNYQAAISELDKILKANPYDADALLTKADILRKQGQKAQAELALTTLLAVDSSNAGANEMLYYLYRESGKTKNASELLENMPIAVAEKIKAATAAKPYTDPIPPIRDKAKSLALSGNTADAIEVLQDGINKYPKSSWLRYDLARLLKKEGFDAGAFEQISYLTRNDASDEDLLAAATFMNEFKLYAQSMSTLGRVKTSNAKITDMKKEVAVNRTFAQVEMYLGSGNRQAALNTLRMNRYKNSELKDSQLSHLAYLYLKAGDSVTALSLAEEAASRPVKADASLADYADLITVFNETGHADKALMFSSNEAILANSDYSDIEKLKIGESVRKADALRELKRYADAYDELYPHLKNNPEDPDLRMAMARIYQDNGRYSESFSIYDKVLDTDPDNQQALNGAINSALADEDYETATDLAMRLKDTDDPRVLTLLARIDSKNRDYDDALIKLRKARALLDSRYDYSASVNLKDPDLSVSSSKRATGNPFANKSKASDIKSTSATLPWEKKDSKTGEFAMLPAQRKDAINEINFMIRDLKERVATTATVSLEGRQKDGEDGMSKVNALSVPITISTPVLGGAKLSLSARMDSYNAGSLSTSSASEFGTNALYVGVQNMVERINALKKDYQNAGSDPGNQHAFIVQNGLESLSSSDLAVLLDPTMLNASDYNIQTAAGRQKLIEYFNSYSDPRAAMSAVNTAKSITTVMMDAKAKRTTGVGFAASLKDDRYKVDFGVTPVGKDGTTVVAGAFVRQPLTSFSELRVKAERTAMTDSLLSYFGYLDRLSGTYWGGVTKNGGLMEYAYDNGFLGTSLQANVYRYLGKNVRSNTSYGFKGALYVHPFKPTMYEDMTVGLSLSYDNYSHNENHFSFGHGGYFSPQHYYIASIPFTYMKKTDDLKFTADLALGYQSYKEQEEDLFPTNSEYQESMNTLAGYGFITSSRFARKSESGIGGSVKLNLDYYLLDDLVVGGSVSYNTFGDYKEMYQMLYIKSVIGGQ